MNSRAFLVIFLCALVFLASSEWSVTPVEAYPATIKVPDDYPTIQEAVDAASPGDTIQVAAGIYYERLTVNKSLALVGESRETTIIDGNRTGTVIYVASSDVTIQDFTIQYGIWHYPGNTVFVNFSHNILIKDNKIMGSHHGIDLTNSNNVSIVGNDMVDNSFVGIFVSYCRNCSIHENRMMRNDHGIRLHRSEAITVCMNTISANGYHPFSAIDVWYSQYNYVLKNSIVTGHNNGISLLFSNFTVVEENKVADCYGTGITLDASHNNTIYHNSFLGNNRQISISAYSNSNIFDNGAEGNYWSDYNGTDLYFGPYQNITGSDGIGDTPYVIDGNNQDNYPLIHPYGSIRNLDTNLTYLTIQSAIEAPETLGGHTIYVEEGTYYENVVVGKAISLIGENRNTTIIDGQGYRSVIDVEHANVSISGFTIVDSAIPLCSGIEIDKSNYVNVTNNIITNNNGYGVEIYGASYFNVVSDNIITNNQAVGILIYDPDDKAGWNIIKANTIINNNGSGIGISESHGNTLEDNVMATQGTGMFFNHAANNTIKNNHIANNQKGINLWGYHTSGNSFFHNNFINNTHQAYGEYISSNAWDNGYPSGGNYWSSHNPPDLYSGPYQNEAGSDGIGDIPYILEENNIDRYPLIYPYGYVPSPDVNGDEIVDVSDVDTVAEAFGSRPGDPNWNPIADLNSDFVIDIFDIVLLANNFGKTV